MTSSELSDGIARRTAAAGKFHPAMRVSERDIVEIPGEGYLLLKLAGPLGFNKGVEVHALLDGQEKPLLGHVQYSVNLTEEFDIEWIETPGIFWTKGSRDPELVAFVNAHAPSAFASLCEDRPQDYQMLVSSMFYHKAWSLRQAANELLDLPADTQNFDPETAGLDPELFEDRVVMVEEMSEAIQGWIRDHKNPSRLSFQEFVDQLIQHAKADLLSGPEASVEEDDVPAFK